MTSWEAEHDPAAGGEDRQAARHRAGDGGRAHLGGPAAATSCIRPTSRAVWRAASKRCSQRARGAARERLAQRRIVDQGRHRLVQGAPVADLHEPARVAAVEQVRDAADVGGDHRRAAGHRLQHRERHRVAARGQAEDVGLLVELGQRRVAGRELMHAQAGPLLQARRGDDVEVSRRADQRAERVDQLRAALLLQAAADEQHPRRPARALGPRPERLQVDPRVEDDDARPRGAPLGDRQSTWRTRARRGRLQRALLERQARRDDRLRVRVLPDAHLVPLPDGRVERQQRRYTAHVAVREERDRVAVDVQHVGGLAAGELAIDHAPRADALRQVPADGVQVEVGVLEVGDATHRRARERPGRRQRGEAGGRRPAVASSWRRTPCARAWPMTPGPSAPSPMKSARSVVSMRSGEGIGGGRSESRDASSCAAVLAAASR